MIYFLRKYLKYIITFIFTIMLFVLIYKNNTKIVKVSAKEGGLKLKQEEKKESKTLFVDVKGAVNNPGVYELESGKRVIDAINKAGGLSNNSNSININLSKKLEDEMVIIVYTKNEILNYKNNGSNKVISCASNECICPDSNNEVCVKKDSSSTKTSKSNNIQTNSKVSINTASKEELMTLSGVGDAKAQKIIEYREKNGSFKTLEDIKNVSGIGDSMYEKIKDNITL